jgi:hypothetical protein
MRSCRFKDLQELSHGSEAASTAPLRRKLLRLHLDGAAPPGFCSIEFNMTGLSSGIACNLGVPGSALLRRVADLREIRGVLEWNCRSLGYAPTARRGRRDDKG